MHLGIRQDASRTYRESWYQRRRLNNRGMLPCAAAVQSATAQQHGRCMPPPAMIVAQAAAKAHWNMKKEKECVVLLPNST